MFIAIGVLLVLAWILAFVVLHVTGFFIHLLLIVAVISIAWHFIAGRRKA